MMNFLMTFIILSIVNVVFSTVRSITTIKSGKTIASLISGGYFAFYNVMLVWTVADFPMWQKCVITFACNVIGVWIVKFVEEKMRKDKLWQIQMTVKSRNVDELHDALKQFNIPHNYVDNLGEHALFMCYAKTQNDSIIIKNLGNRYKAKFFVTETKIL